MFLFFKICVHLQLKRTCLDWQISEYYLGLDTKLKKKRIFIAL
jgi:hypothetical protein